MSIRRAPTASPSSATRPRCVRRCSSMARSCPWQNWTWGRARYWVSNIEEVNKRVANNKALPLLDTVEPIILRNNRWRCDHGSDIDLDDGSSNYRTENNLCLKGGIKFREGFLRWLLNCIMFNNSFYEDKQGKTCVEYDKPSSLFGQFGNAKVTEVAKMLDQKLERLVAEAIQ